MTTNDFDKQSEEKLNQYLKSNQPMPPPAKYGEEQKILNAITREHLKGQKKKQRSFFPSLKWFIPAAAAAVIVLAVWLRPTDPTMVSSDANIDEYLYETVGTVYNSNDEDTVGENYLYLAEVVSASM